MYLSFVKEFPCKCVTTEVFKKGKWTRFKLIVDKRKLTSKDELSTTLRIKTYDDTYIKTYQSNTFTMQIKIIYTPGYYQKPQPQVTPSYPLIFNYNKSAQA